MKTELHCHTSRYSACSTNTPEEMMAGLIEAGYQAVYISEHNALWRTDELADLQADFPQIRIFPAVELSDPATRQHVLILGATDPAYIPLAEAGLWDNVLDLAARQGCLTVLAHPFRFSDGHCLLDQGLATGALELRTGNHDQAMADLTLPVARQCSLPTVNAGDLHALEMINKFWIETDRDLTQACDIRQVVLDSAYTNVAAE